MREKDFYLLLLLCAILSLVFCIILTYTDYSASLDNHMQINGMEQKIQNQLKLPGTENMTQLEKIRYHDEIYSKMIDWQGQGTINWGLGF